MGTGQEMPPSVQLTKLCGLHYNTNWTRVGSLALPSLNTRIFRCTSQPHYVSCQNTHHVSVLCLLITATIALTSHSTVCSRCVHVYNIDIHNRKCSSGGEVQSRGTKHSKILKIKILSYRATIRQLLGLASPCGLWQNIRTYR